MRRPWFRIVVSVGALVLLSLHVFLLGVRLQSVRPMAAAAAQVYLHDWNTSKVNDVGANNVSTDVIVKAESDRNIRHRELLACKTYLGGGPPLLTLFTTFHSSRRKVTSTTAVKPPTPSDLKTTAQIN